MRAGASVSALPPLIAFPSPSHIYFIDLLEVPVEVGFRDETLAHRFSCQCAHIGQIIVTQIKPHQPIKAQKSLSIRLLNHETEGLTTVLFHA